MRKMVQKLDGAYFDRMESVKVEIVVLVIVVVNPTCRTGSVRGRLRRHRVAFVARSWRCETKYQVGR